MIVTLSTADVRRCTYLAVERWVEKIGSKDKESYAIGRKNKYLEHDMLNSIRANVSEWAVAKQFGLVWNGGITYDNSDHESRRYLPDVGDTTFPVEVRTRRTGGEFGFWKYDLDKKGRVVFTEVLDDNTFLEVKLIGWLPIEECGVPEWWDEGMGRYYVPESEMRSMDTFEAIA